MKVKDLLKLLQEEDPNRVVILQKDAEGNGYSPLEGIDRASYRAKSTWSGETGLEELTDELRSQGYIEEDVIRDGEKAIILYPVN